MKNAILALAIITLPVAGLAQGRNSSGGRMGRSHFARSSRTFAPRGFVPDRDSGTHSFPAQEEATRGEASRFVSGRASGVRSFPVHGSGFRGGASRGVARGSFGRAAKAAPTPPTSAPQTPTPAPETPTPAPWAVPGALIRTEGLGFTEGPGGPFSQLTINAGDKVGADGARALENQPGLFRGPKDALPPPSPQAGGAAASGRTAITPNGSGNN